MAEYPKDRFDEIPTDLQRTGAHRAPKKKGRGWVAFGWAAFATILLTFGGLVGLAAIDSSINFDLPFFQAPEEETPSPTQVPTAEPTVAPDVPISVLNGTPTVGLANQVGDLLVAQGWEGAAIGVGSRANASDNDIDKTIVYYSDPSYEGAARGLVQALQVGEVRLSTDFTGAPLTVVIGADYKPVASPAP